MKVTSLPIDELFGLAERCQSKLERDKQVSKLEVMAMQRVAWVEATEQAITQYLEAVNETRPPEQRIDLAANPVHVTMIDDHALAAREKQWVPHLGGLTEGDDYFNWDEVTRIPYYQQSMDMQRFEMAVYLGDNLMTLAIGEKGDDHVASDFIERGRTPAAAALKGHAYNIRQVALELWAQTVGVNQVCVFDPSPHTKAKCEAEGYVYRDTIKELGEKTGPAFYPYMSKSMDGANAQDFPLILSPIDLSNLGEAYDPKQHFSTTGHIPAAVTRAAQREVKSRYGGYPEAIPV